MQAISETTNEDGSNLDARIKGADDDGREFKLRRTRQGMHRKLPASNATHVGDGGRMRVIITAVFGDVRFLSGNFL